MFLFKFIKFSFCLSSPTNELTLMKKLKLTECKKNIKEFWTCLTQLDECLLRLLGIAEVNRFF